MPIVNNILVAPIGPAEAYSYVGIAPSGGIYDVFTLLSSDRINKWAKCKPIRYDKKEELTEIERMGSVQDRMNGIYYGLKLSGAGGRLEDMHEVTFDYYPIRAGEDWGRLTDLDGYDKNAKPNPVGSLPEVIYIDFVNARGDCYISYDQSNTTGVDISAILSQISHESYDLGDMYPCVLVTINNQKYVRALRNARYSGDDMVSSDNGFTTLRHNGAWWNHWEMVLSGLPDVSDGVEITATIFFIRNILPSDTVASVDFREWRNVNMMLSVYNGYACPEAVAKKILLKRYYTKGLEIIGGNWSAKSSSSTIVTLSLVYRWIEPDENVDYTLFGYVFLNDNAMTMTTFSKTYRYRPDLGMLMNIEIDTGMLMLSNSAKFRIEWQVTSSANPTRPCNSGTTEVGNINVTPIDIE